MALSSPGIGSNLDVSSIVTQLMSVERQPLTKLDREEASAQAQLSAYGSIKGALSSFQSAVKSLSDFSKFNTVSASSSDAASVGATASSSGIAGTYSVNVSKLAQSQSLATAGRANATDVIGTGSLTFYYGTYTAAPAAFDLNSSKSAQTVTIDAAHSSLSGIRDAINAAKIGVTASIVNDGSSNGYKLVVTSNDTGKANSLKIDVSGDAGLVSALKYDPVGVKNMSEAQAAQNAEFTVNGVSMSKASNTLTDALDGVTLNLLKTTTSPVTVKVATDSGSIKSSVNGLVRAYNDLNKGIKELTAYNATTKQASILTGDSTLRVIQTQVRSTLASALGNGNLRTLSQVGISFQKDGTLALDASKLDAAIASNSSDVVALFAAFGIPTDPYVKFVGSGKSTVAGSYPINITKTATVGKSVGSNPAGLTINSTNKTLGLNVDGVTASVTLGEAVYADADALAAEVQGKINGASAFSSAGVSVAVAQQGKTVGAQAANLTITAGMNDALDVNLDGVTTTVTIDPLGYADADALATAVQNAINGAPAFSAAGKTVTVTQSAGILTISSNLVGTGSKLTVTGGNGAVDLLGAGRSSGGAIHISSTRYGSASKVIVTDGVAKTNLLGATPTDTVGEDVEGTIGGEAAVGSGQSLTGSGTNVKDLKISVTGGSTGGRGTISFSKGLAYQLDQMLDSVLGSDGLLEAKTDGINDTIKDIGKRRTVWQTRLVGVEQRYRKQFTSLDQLVSRLNSTSSFLTQQLATLSKLSSGG